MARRIEQKIVVVALAVSLLLGSGFPALACTICYGEPGHPMTLGLQNGVLILLGSITGVLGLFVGLIIFVARRSRRLQDEQDGENRTAAQT